MSTFVDDLLNDLSKEEKVGDYQDCNNDYDCSEVLKLCAGNTTSTHILRYPDGQEKEFSFNNQAQ